MGLTIHAMAPTRWQATLEARWLEAEFRGACEYLHAQPKPRTMRLLLLSLTALWALGSLGQHTPRDFFVIDPYEANGYFITAPELLDKLAAAKIRVDVIARADDGQGGTTHSVVQTFNLDRQSQHGRASRDLIDALPAGTEVAYDAYALSGTNSPVGEIHAWRPGPIVSEKCNLICDQNRHGWKLTAFADAGNGNTSIDISNPGRYFFVTTHNQHWEAFKNQNNGQSYLWYGLAPWFTYDYPGAGNQGQQQSIDCFRIAAPDPPNANTATCVGLPDENGYPLPATVANSPAGPSARTRATGATCTRAPTRYSAWATCATPNPARVLRICWPTTTLTTWSRTPLPP